MCGSTLTRLCSKISTERAFRGTDGGRAAAAAWFFAWLGGKRAVEATYC